ncbi:SWPV1-180 [Shearwaterpox virus]|uniref:SWPV1-180 n=1 Tax=Shearwaterpox virus TaxID=1974596 RepID=A0A1V0S804_CNPV|nr:SWPV1-180 [Shearwaterpox virus]
MEEQQKVVDGGVPPQHQQHNKGQEKMPVTVPTKQKASDNSGTKDLKQLPEKNS